MPRRGRTSRVGSVVVGGWLAVAAPAMADEYDSAIARGVAARDHALESGSVQDWKEALDLFDLATEIRGTKEAEFEFAESAVHLHLDDEAFAAYGEALDLGLHGKAEELARAFVEGHRAQMAALAVEGPAGAAVIVGERRRAVLPLGRPLVVSAGVVRVRLEMPRFQPWESNVVAEAGATTAVVGHLVPEAAAPAVAETDKAVASPEPIVAGPWARPVFIGGVVAMVSGGAAIALTTVLSDQKQRTLEQQCVLFQGSICTSTTPGQRAAAQSTADDVATLVNLRWVAIGLASAGGVAFTAALFELWSAGRSSGRGFGASVRISERGGSVEWQGAF